MLRRVEHRRKALVRLRRRLRVAQSEVEAHERVAGYLTERPRSAILLVVLSNAADPTVIGKPNRRTSATRASAASARANPHLCATTETSMGS